MGSVAIQLYAGECTPRVDLVLVLNICLWCCVMKCKLATATVSSYW